MASTPPENAALCQPPGAQSKRRPLVLLLPLLPVIAIALAYKFGGLDRFDSPERIAAAARSLTHSPLTIVWVLLGFGLGTLLFIPVTALIAATAIAFSPATSIAYALAGVLFGATTTYWCGRLLGARALDYFSGRRLERIKRELCTRALRASIVARLMPVGNFTVINVLAGSMRVPFRAYFVGNAVGAAPGVVAIALFADQLSAAIKNPDARTLAIVAALVVLLAAAAFLLRRAARRREASSPDGGLAS